MTLIVPPGEDLFASDGDSGCLGSSPDEGGEGGMHVSESSQAFLKKELKRVSLTDEVPPAPSGQDVPVTTDGQDVSLSLKGPATPPIREGKDTNGVKSDSDSVQYQSCVYNGSCHIQDVRDSEHKLVKVGVEGTCPPTPRPVVYESRVSLDTAPQCANGDPRSKLEGPALVSVPKVLVASKVNSCQEQGAPDTCIPLASQTNVSVMQLVLPPPHPDASITIGDVAEVRAQDLSGKLEETDGVVDGDATRPSGDDGGDKTSDKDSDVRGSKDSGNSDSPSNLSVENGKGEISSENREKNNNNSGIKDVRKIRDCVSVGEKITEVNCKRDSPNEQLLSPKADKEDIDIHAAKQKINLLRQNFLSSLSSDDGSDTADPLLSSPPAGPTTPSQGEGPEGRLSSKKGESAPSETRDEPADEQPACSVDAGQQEGEGNREKEVAGDSYCPPVENETRQPDTTIPASEAPVSSEVIGCTRIAGEKNGTPTNEQGDPATTPEEGDVSRSAGRSTESETVPTAARMGPKCGNVIAECDITPGTNLEGGTTVDSTAVVNLHPHSPQLPPTPPSSPPGEKSHARPPCMKGHSANLVNKLMYESSKYRRGNKGEQKREEEEDVMVSSCPSVLQTSPHVARGEEVAWRAGRECESQPAPPLPALPLAQPPRQHGNPHVQRPSANAHCGTQDQLCHQLALSPAGGAGEDRTQGARHLSPPLLRRDAGESQEEEHQGGLLVALTGEAPCCGTYDVRPGHARLAKRCSIEECHSRQCCVPVDSAAVTSTGHCAEQCVQIEPDPRGERQPSCACPRPRLRTTSLGHKQSLVNACASRRCSGCDRCSASDSETALESSSCCNEISCLHYLNLEPGDLLDSDAEYDIEQKNRLRAACEDIARALNTLPPPQPPDYPPPPTGVSNFSGGHAPAPQYRDQQVEAHLSDSEDQLGVDNLHVHMRSRGTSTASDEERRSSVYDNCGMDGGMCECGQCHASDREDYTQVSPRPPASARKRSRGRKETDRSSCGSERDASDRDLEDEGFRTDAGEGCRTDEFDLCTTSDDNDYDDDYCQTDDCGEECDYCSGDDAEDEDEGSCYMCKQSQIISPACKHPGVITNGILKSLSGRRANEKEAVRVPRQRSLALQAAIHRRQLTRQGLGAIRESSITSDELAESEEERSYDGSNCDISSSWRFGLCRDLTASRDSTLRSVRSERSSASLPFDKSRQRHKEKSNSLPGANSRGLAGDATGRHLGAGVSPLRQASTSDDESGSHSSLPRLPPRPPRAPRMRPPLTPSPPAAGAGMPPPSPNSPRPAMGLQGLQQQRSPGTPRALHASGLPVAPRTVAPRSPSNPNPPYGFPGAGSGNALLCPGSPNLTGHHSTPSPAGSEGAPASPRISSRAGALVTRNFSISDDESGGRWAGGRRHVTITRHESVYREVAEKGYHLPPGSPVDPYWLTWKLGVLQKTVEEVSGRLEEAQKTVDTWAAVPQDPNLADQHVHNVRKFREGLAELQRGVDDVNDQAARFSAHNVPLTPANSAKLHDLNNRWKTLETAVNDRWRQVAGRSREVTPLTPAQLASSVSPPWERATTSNKVPYYINHDQESTHWDHPTMMDLLDSLTEFNHIKFSAYRTATKLRMLQKTLALDRAKMQMATDVFDEHGLRGQNDRLIDVGDMVVVLSALYANISADHPDVNTTLAMDLCLNWLLNVYDSQRTGQMRVLSFKIGIVCLCRGHLEEKYRYMFRLIADPNRLVDQRKLGLLLHDCVQVPRQLGEVAAFGGSNIEPSVRSCFTKAGKDRETIEAVHFLTWVQQEPQSLVWLAVLHRVAASENIQHQVKCNICKAYPIVGLRYRCLKCLSFDMCQRCFFDGRSGKSHKITHPMHEYCTATTAGEDVKDFTKALKNKFKSKRALQKHTKKGYLPVQTVLEGDPLESPSPSPQHNVTSQDMHSRLELYASRLAEVELRTNSNSTPDRSLVSSLSEDEHGLIAQYCQSLSSSDAPLPVPRSPLQIMAAVDAEQKDELEQMIRALEEENSQLQAEYDRLKSQQPVGSPPDDGLSGQRSEADMLAEAKLLRQHKGRLEARMGILEEHNRQLEAQLHRLRQLLGEPGGMSSPNKSGTLQTKSVTASQLAMDSPAKVNGHSNQGDLGKAVGTLVATMTHEGASDLPSDEEEGSEASDTEEEKAV
ncbi:uncharacterized protein LOC122259537 isoform X3 [Penaeus japonicus]|uniref:uncharacterized protein LOC122259537 isoform X3 n=1 Tax=Penaeus japonicus TaxID=27405 RepID=UPI001C70BB72|nr:uncharacterized protein LOC122259537 isoform X3 [Penaeus japonicus]